MTREEYMEEVATVFRDLLIGIATEQIDVDEATEIMATTMADMMNIMLLEYLPAVADKAAKEVYEIEKLEDQFGLEGPDV